MPHLTPFGHNADPKSKGRVLDLPVNIGPRQKGNQGTNLFEELPKISLKKKKGFKIDTTWWFKKSTSRDWGKVTRSSGSISLLMLTITKAAGMKKRSETVAKIQQSLVTKILMLLHFL
jgi:hypothetical protein